MKIEIEIPDEDWTELWRKYITAKTSQPEELLEWDELEPAWRAYYGIVEQNDQMRMLSLMHEYIDREFAKGKRCGVCGMTSAQAKAANYDCAREC